MSWELFIRNLREFFSFPLLKILSSFLLCQKTLQKFFIHNFVKFFNFPETVSCSQIMWFCFAIWEFENVMCVVNLLFEIYNGLEYG